jgi:hypothetical protein
MPRPSVEERCRRDLAAGRPWVARDRLYGALRDRPADPALWTLLAEVHEDMRDLPAAGAAWFLTDRGDDDAQAAAALAALRSRHTSVQSLAHVIAVRCAPEELAPAAQSRVATVQDQLAAQGWSWEPPAHPRRGGPHRRDAAGGATPGPVPRGATRRLARSLRRILLALAMTAATLGIWGIGAWTVLRRLW